MGDRVLSPQSKLVAGNDREPIPTGDVAISVRNVGKMYYVAPLPWGSLDVFGEENRKGDGSH